MTDIAGLDPSNVSGDPGFRAWYFNGQRGTTHQMQEIQTPIQVPAAFDEGGNWIKVRYAPLTLWPAVSTNPLVLAESDYHLNNNGSFDVGQLLTGLDPALTALLVKDFDGQGRPQGAGPDPGADEKQ